MTRPLFRRFPNPITPFGWQIIGALTLCVLAAAAVYFTGA